MAKTGPFISSSTPFGSWGGIVRAWELLQRTAQQEERTQSGDGKMFAAMVHVGDELCLSGGGNRTPFVFLVCPKCNDRGILLQSHQYFNYFVVVYQRRSILTQKAEALHFASTLRQNDTICPVFIEWHFVLLWLDSSVCAFYLCSCSVRYILSASSYCFHCWHGKAKLCVGISFFTHIFSSGSLKEPSRECHSSAEVWRETRCNRMATWMLHLPN